MSRIFRLFVTVERMKEYAQENRLDWSIDTIDKWYDQQLICEAEYLAALETIKYGRISEYTLG